MNAKTKDYHVADIKQADFGRKEIAIAETEMPGLMAVREEYKGKQVSIKKAGEELGWKPKTSFEEGMKRYVEWARENRN